MGFKNGAKCKVWEVKSISDKMTRIRISTSRKDRDTGEFEQDFGGYAVVIGADAKRAMSLQKGSMITLGEVEVTTRYEKDTKQEYVNYRIFSFEDYAPGQQTTKQAAPSANKTEEEAENEGGGLPF